MIENILIRKQTPTEGMWLYRFDGTQYIISNCVYLGKNDTEWEECNEEQKVEFEKHNEKQLEGDENEN
jgi:hypothetical protein